MIKVGIAGASGYTGLELIRLLANHPEVELSVLTSETYKEKSIADVFPSLNGIININLQSLDVEILKSCDVIFLALPHTIGMDILPELLKSNCKVIDLSADYRLKNADTYSEWYSLTHTHPEFLSQVIYGLPELHREKIKSAQGVANPGCYPTSVILAIAPLLKTDWVDLESIVSDSKSGVSGAGRKTSITTQFSEANEGVTPYGLASHRHTPEIEQELSNLIGKPIKISFSPHLIPMSRGMLSTIYINLNHKLKDENLIEHYENFYSNWRASSKKAGGGILLDQGIHMLDLLLYFAEDFEEAKAYASNLYWKGDIEDNVFALFRNNKGQVASLHSTMTQWRHLFSLESQLLALLNMDLVI